MSNLSRQFLFRNHHIGQHKSAVAAQAARAINNQMQVRGLIEKVAGETEHIFNEHFWETHSVVLNALDNLESRKYVDSRCIFFRRPLFDSGTLGTKCNVQCVVPYCTESYSSSHDPPEKSIPLCTLKNFPNAIEHTIQWARENFESVFNSLPTDVNAYLGDPTAFSANLERNPGTKATVLRSVHTALSQWPTDAADCVRIARRLHHDYFNVSFKQLLHNLPLDKRNEHGELFWSGAKKPPSPQEFSSDSELHVSFVYHCAQLVARTYGLPPITLSAAEVAEVARLTDVQEFVPCEFRLATSEADKEESAAQAACELSLQDLPPVTQFGSRRMFPQEFEKDDPSNSHMDYITYCSNIRATAYNIPPADLHHTKRIAGKIIPAMVTTTSLVTGLVGVETLKYLLLHRQRERVQGITMRSGGIAVAHPLSVEARRKYLGIFRNAFVNVALPFATFSDPLPDPARIYELPDGSSVSWGIWDRIEVNEGRDVTVEELVALIEQRYQLEVFIIALPSGKMLYSQFGNVKDRKKPVSLVAQQREGGSTSENRCLCLIVTGSIGVVDVDVPLVHYRF
ncbi:ThiF family Ubiquitin activating enzyme active site Ubiquitin fold domain [Trypanosoma vivax]|nr:ThiF family Ubiquitin activating enzyme active site Ubiquitin fold domain [Trypanosoma vivax]